MYRLESFNKKGALVTNTEFLYNSTFLAANVEEAEYIVICLNRDVLLRQLAIHRYAVEIGGLELTNGLRMLTDRDNRGTFKECYQDMKNGLIPDTDWKGVGIWKTVDLAEMEGMAKALSAHVRGCYRGEFAVATAISAAATIQATEEIDIEGQFNEAYQKAFNEVMTPEQAAE